MMEFLVKLAGAERVSLGTDYPFPLGEDVAGSLINELNFDEETKAKLLHETALEWLNLEKQLFL